MSADDGSAAPPGRLDPAARAHALVASFAAREAPGAWRLDRRAVAQRLDELIDRPDEVRQGRLNLCGPAVALVLWLRRDPVAAVAGAVRLYERGSTTFGTVTVTASPALRRVPYARTSAAATCPPAEWMVMAALRDSTNRVLRYTPHGPREAAAAITLPGALAGWLRALGRPVRDETRLVRRKGIAHALGLDPGPGRIPVALVAQEMFRRPDSGWGRARDRVTSLVPNHWVILRSPVTLADAAEPDRVTFRFWSWGREQDASIERSLFRRCYAGALIVG